MAVNIMKLSFVIPAYNEEKYIGKCLLSVFKELEGKDYDTEVIVVNNACTDRTRQIAAEFPGVRIVDEMEKGLVPARRAGFLASSGDLIANVDADTMLSPGWTEKVFKEFSKDENLVALSGPFIYYDLTGFVSFWVQVFYYLGFLSNLINHHIFRGGSVLQGGNFIVTREALEKIGGYNPDLNFYGEDVDIARRIRKVGNVKFTLGLPMYASGRRLKAEGALMTGIRAMLDYLWIMFTKKPFRKHAVTDIRLQEQETGAEEKRRR
ncbi:MAG: glycosyltransferase family 2 protein [bacterium]